MTNLSKALLGSAAIVALASPAMAEEHPTPVYVDQLQLENVWSNIKVHTPESTGDITASGLAVSNSASTYIAHGAMTTNSKQVSVAEVASNVKVNAADASNGAIIAANTASGNLSYAGNWYGDGLVAVQQTQIGNVTATTRVRTDSTQNISSQTTAVANVSEIASDYGHHVDTHQDQFANATVTADARVNAGIVEGDAVNAAIAAGNSADTAVDGVPDGWVNANQTTSTGTFVTSTANTRVQSADNVITASNAAGNQFNASSLNANTFIGRQEAPLNQENNATVTSIARTNVTSFNTEAAAIGAGVGNSAQVSALGGAVDYHAVQNNNANVNTFVTLNAGSLNGGAGHTSAASIGNSYAIVAQDGKMGASVVQTNTSAIASQARVRTNQIGAITASSAAIGNSATFETRATGQDH